MKVLYELANCIKGNTDLSWEPSIFKISDSSEKEKLYTLLKSNNNISIFDEIKSQLLELKKLQNPSIKFSKEDLEIVVNNHLDGKSIDEYGVWVYYPWSNRLVHCLDEEEFTLVRTNRNIYKITPEERALLSKQKVGVIGLSVGQSVSLALAMERSFGELRIADFDTLELSNLNRIRTGIHTIGLPKTIVTAREIAEIDPFLKITCYHEGITEENIHDFLMKDGKLDVLIEESDGLNIKIKSRIEARKLNIPVIMDSSDRGMLDIERFDLEPDRPIFHGLIEHLDLNLLKTAKTNEEKVPFILAIVGVDTMSKRMKATLPEIEESVSTWPQLATSVILGGAIAADTYRRLVLGENIRSGRYFFDPNDIVNSNISEKIPTNFKEIYTQTFGNKIDKENLIKDINELKLDQTLEEKNSIRLDNSIVESLIESAIQAPSGGNCQPWKWVYTTEYILLLFHDEYYSKSLLDIESSGSYIAFGAAIENLELKANSIGLSISTRLFPLGKNKKLIASISFSKYENQDYSKLVDYISKRCTNRNIENKIAIETKILDDLSTSIEKIPNASIQFLSSEKELKELSEIISAADRIRMLNPYGHFDLFEREMRWNHQEAEKTADGIDINTLDITYSEKAGLQVAKDWEAIRLIKEWKKGKAFEKISKKTVLASSAYGILSMEGTTEQEYFNAGKALQTIWLTATKNNISLQPQAPILFLFSRLFRGNAEMLDTTEIEELKTLKTRFEKLVSPNNTKHEVFIFRLTIGQKPVVKSFRKPVKDVLLYE